MIRKLRIVCPLCILCLAILVFCLIGLSSRSASQEALAVQNPAVTSTADAVGAAEMAAPAVAKETSAAQEPDAAENVAAPVVVEHPEEAVYELTDADRITIECIVMCEAGGEGTDGQMMVAQCIREGLLRYGYSLDEYIYNYKVELTAYSNVTDEVRESVSRVFDDGERFTDAKADLWYNPAITSSPWHEKQQYVTTVGSHRFFWMIDNTHS